VNLGRCSGILLHVTSLPSQFGIGDLGPESRHFADFLSAAKQKLWCVLPLGPTGPQNSPYECRSAFAGNALLVSPELLVDAGYLSRKDLRNAPRFPASRVDFASVRFYKEALLKKAFREFSETRAYSKFERAQSWWLERFALFMSLREANEGAPWTHFNPKIKPDPQSIRYHKFVQYEFFRQWQSLRKYCAKRNVSIMGDLPFYLEHDSADVWSHPEIFDLDSNGESRTVGGVPPDYFSRDGQRWGTPTYRWDKLKQTGFKWWVDRFRAATKMMDLLRLDHFRGFEAYWSIPASHPTARKGRWVKGPGARLFEAAEKKLGALPFVAENLGIITPEVEDLRRRFALPGMAVLQFGFGDDAGNRPTNYIQELVSFTGTHDNDTSQGWWRALQRSARASSSRSSDAATLNRVKCYLQRDGREINWSLIQAVLTSVANIAIIPMQDVLGLGSEARMNQPGKAKGNWRWRLQKEQIDQTVVQRLRGLTEVAAR
jgi:4-alpha-glucanotransferase